MTDIWKYIFTMSAVTFLIRAIPITFIHKKISNRFLKSFLYYVPYATLAVMTFPAIIEASGNRFAGIAAFIIGILAAYLGQSLLNVAVICCAAVLLISYLPF